MMKKILALMLSVSMIAGLAACGSKETEAPATDAPAEIGRASCRERVSA